MPFRVFMLSMVRKERVCTHILVEQAESGSPILVNGQPFGVSTFAFSLDCIGWLISEKVSEIPALIEVLKRTEDFALTRPPYHCQPWYHGHINQHVSATICFAPVLLLIIDISLPYSTFRSVVLFLIYSCFS